MWVFFKNLSNLCKKNQFCWTCYTYFTGQCWKFWGRRQNSLPAIPALPAGTDVASWRDRLHSQPLLQLHGEQSPDVAKGGEGRCLAPKVLSPKVTSYLGWKRGYKLRACRLDLVKGCRNAFCLVFYNALRFEIFHIKIHFLIFFFSLTMECQCWTSSAAWQKLSELSVRDSVRDVTILSRTRVASFTHLQKFPGPYWKVGGEAYNPLKLWVPLNCRIYS